MDNDQLPFSEVLDRLFQERTVPVALVYRLSDMTPAESDTFDQRWSEQPDDRRRIIARHMADISEENFVVDFSPVFMRLLADASPAVRLAALDGLWDTSNLDVVPRVLDLMRSDVDSEVRAAAASTLGHFILLGEWGQVEKRVADRIVEALLEQFARRDLPLAVRRATLESLGNAAHPRVPELIDDAYRRGEEELQVSAIFAMGRSCDRRWVPILIDEMANPETEMRVEAARAAGAIGSSDAVDRLIELLDDEDLEVQLAAVSSLGQIGSEQAHAALNRVMDDPDADLLHEAVEQALDEIEWLGAEIDLTIMEWDDELDSEL